MVWVEMEEGTRGITGNENNTIKIKKPLLIYNSHIVQFTHSTIHQFEEYNSMSISMYSVVMKILMLFYSLVSVVTLLAHISIQISDSFEKENTTSSAMEGQ